MEQNSTLKRLSEKLNLSVSTVSRALKDHPDISDATKQRVKELAAMLDYEPNSFAIQLRKNQSSVLGILVPSVANFFYDSFISAVEQEARKEGYSVLIMQSGENAAVEAANLKLLKKNRIAGIFVSLTPETTDIEPFFNLQNRKIPIIFFDRVPEFEACNKICLPDAYAAKIAAEALIEKNKKHVLAVFGYPSLSICKKRSEAFIKTFEELSPSTQLDIEFLPDNEVKAACIKHLNKHDRPDAIFCMGDLILIGVMQAIYEKKLHVPHDISVITMSNGFIPALFNPKVTYVETSGYKLGKLAFSRMVECLSGKSFMQELFIDSFLVEGESL